MRRMGGGVAVIPTNRLVRRSNDIDFKFRPGSDFYYLTGFPEPRAVAVLAPEREQRFVLFVQPRDPEQETWTGRRAGVDGARAAFGADAAHSIEDLEKELPELLENASSLHYRVGPDPAFDARVARWIESIRARGRTGVRAPASIHDPGEILHEMRLRKEPGELERMRRAAAVTDEAHRASMRDSTPGRMESEIEALVDFIFRRAGAWGPSYPSIVASGANATILHYVENRRRLEKGDLLLLDAGCEVDLYAADVTRTFPVSGKFSGPQRSVYEVVLEAQRRAIEAVAPGVLFEDVHAASLRALVEGMIGLGWLEGEVEALVESKGYRPFFMHRTSHWLGLDVHDVGAYVVDGKSRALEPGMVLTVEPGLYVAPESESVAAEFRGIGVRIEDDVLVTPDGREVLTAATPKAIGEVEAACAR